MRLVFVDAHCDHGADMDHANHDERKPAVDSMGMAVVDKSVVVVDTIGYCQWFGGAAGAGAGINAGASTEADKAAEAPLATWSRCDSMKWALAGGLSRVAVGGKAACRQTQ